MATEQINQELEDAADKASLRIYAYESEPRINRDAKIGFIDGANWQKEQILEESKDIINDKYPFVGIYQEDKVILKQQRAFSVGIRYQKEQSATDAIEFFKWVNLNYIEHGSHYEDNIKISSYVHRSEGGVPSRIEKLYELWKQTKTQ